ncbi:fer3-like protein [Gigantopelta aegis]|uniref:fer3-like protein n=1 Tax=Gigantopelta aegis TaxID=1735272 RepID=UPI001B888105|nr:fer3-like protein [Gigantopelta aegis]
MTTDGDKPDSETPCETSQGGTGAVNGVVCNSPLQELTAIDEKEDIPYDDDDDVDPMDSDYPFHAALKKKRRRRQTASQRKAANMRERRRMRLLNQAFDRLKRHLPNTTDHNHLSRMQTLKAAIVYIEYLSSLT